MKPIIDQEFLENRTVVYVAALASNAQSGRFSSGVSPAIPGISRVAPAARPGVLRPRWRRTKSGSRMALASAARCVFRRAFAASSASGRAPVSCHGATACLLSTVFGWKVRWRVACLTSPSCWMPWWHRARTIHFRVQSRPTGSRRACAAADHQGASASAQISACAASIQRLPASVRQRCNAAKPWTVRWKRRHRTFRAPSIAFKSSGRSCSRASGVSCFLPNGTASTLTLSGISRRD